LPRRPALTSAGVHEMGTSPSHLAVNPAGTRLYSANETDRSGPDKQGTVSAFAISKSEGTLTLLNTVPSGGAQTLTWQVVPVKAGRYTVHYTVAGGLSGKAKVRLAAGRRVEGQLTADIAPAPPHTHVNPLTGQVVPGQYPSVP